MLYFLVLLQVILLVTQFVSGIKGVRESKPTLVYLSLVAYALLIIISIVIYYGVY